MTPSEFREIAPDEADEILEQIIEAVFELHDMGIREGVQMSHEQHRHLAAREIGILVGVMPTVLTAAKSHYEQAANDRDRAEAALEINFNAAMDGE